MWHKLTHNKIPGTPTTVTFWLVLSAVVTYGTLMFALALPTPPPLIWFCAGLVIGAMFHEGGHALCAFVSNIPIRLISFGVGPLLMHGRVGETTLEWRLLPFAGRVELSPTATDRRFATGFFIIGGVLGNVFLIAIVTCLAFPYAASATARDSLTAVIIAQALFVISNLFPRTLRKNGMASEGLQLLQLLHRSSSTPEVLLEAYRRQISLFRSGLEVKVPGTPTTVTFWLVLGAAVTYGILLFPAAFPTPPHIIWFCAGLAIGAVFHEGGHALCAFVSNIPIRLISFGVGPLLMHGRVGETTLEWRLLPLSGFVAPYPVFTGRRFATGFSIIGGVLGNAFLIAIVIYLAFPYAASLTARNSLIEIIIAQVWIIIISLFPLALGKNEISDGLHLLQLLYRSSSTSEKLLEAYKRLINPYRRGLDVKFEPTSASSRIMYQFLRWDRWANEEARRDSRDAMMRELARGNLRSEEEAVVLDSLLTYGLVSGDTKIRPHLEEWSIRALSLVPNLPTLVGTRGSVLVELGHHEAGKSLLLPLALHVEQHAALAEGKFDAFMIQLSLARAEYALGNVERASVMAAAAQRTAKPILSSPDVRMVMARFDREHWVNEVIE
jgi:Peptidase family M50